MAFRSRLLVPREKLGEVTITVCDLVDEVSTCDCTLYYFLLLCGNIFGETAESRLSSKSLQSHWKLARKRQGKIHHEPEQNPKRHSQNAVTNMRY